ncbi:ABC transporter family substrate-binding protein [Cellulomonas fimi]|uniref:ABC transporter family substrate-binding protein n=1 Tax=Cellulomonas fimi TaxID=1708 RepID=A0A7Y0LXM7_CELFI|nr:ABC transporter family substrate-binding protein [Cellulomonas fimi]NMR19865.1 ABC transporter family substrate-binding protein [Cellulomonas fimi]
MAGVCAVLTGVLVAGCGTASSPPDGDGTAPTTPELADTITVGIDQPPDTYNPGTAESSSIYNAYVGNLTQQAFTTARPDGTLVPNEVYGTYVKTSDDPLTVEYTFAADAVWSDGTPIDFDDALLAWAALSGAYSGDGATGEGDDAEGDAPAEGARPGLFGAASTSGWALVEKLEGEPGDKTFTMVFSEPYPDWEVLAGGFMPAHVAAEEGGLSAADDGAELVEAIRTDDVEALAPVAEFWSTGWSFPDGLTSLPDLDLIPASGPYRYESAAEGALTLVRNERWWGEPARTEHLVFATVGADEMVQALENGEIDVFDQANPTTDMVTRLSALGDAVHVETGESLAYSRLDLDSSSTGVFDDVRVRQAFGRCVPRQDLVDKFARPIEPDSEILQLRELVPAQAAYDQVLDQVPVAAEYRDVDLEGARALLAEARVSTPLRVRVLYAAGSTLRADQVALVAASCNQAGFAVEGRPDPDLFGTLAQRGGWDAAIFGWYASELVTAGESSYVTGGGLNFGGYSNREVDRLWTELGRETDRAAALELRTRLERLLWEDPYNVPLYANPGLLAYSSVVSGPAYNPTQYGSSWNAQTWTKASG